MRRAGFGRKHRVACFATMRWVGIFRRHQPNTYNLRFDGLGVESSDTSFRAFLALVTRGAILAGFPGLTYDKLQSFYENLIVVKTNEFQRSEPE
jgi:hypothetical protein